MQSRSKDPGVILLVLLAAFVLLSLTSCGSSDDSGAPERPDVILATTTSTQDSGLLDELVPVFKADTGYVIKIVAVGTGQALQLGREGNADVLFVHAPEAEKELVEEGSAVDRRLVMHNDFVIVGPIEDPARINGIKQPEEALARIAKSASLFVSRGDDSGTHKKELALWQKANIQPAGEWYIESGQGMGATLRIASEKDGYTLTDRATYLNLKDTLAPLYLEIHVEGAPSLLNIYHVMLVNSERFPLINADGALAWADFLTSKMGQEIIGQYGIDRFGEPLFFPDAGKSELELGLE